MQCKQKEVYIFCRKRRDKKSISPRMAGLYFLLYGMRSCKIRQITQYYSQDTLKRI